jgi:5-methylcytosine-specific restriction endonuclease McrA
VAEPERNSDVAQSNTERGRKYRAAHPERQRARDVAYRAAHREELNAGARRRYAADPERGQATQAAYRRRHPEIAVRRAAERAAIRAAKPARPRAKTGAEIAAAYRLRHPDQAANYRAANRERIRVWAAEYRASHLAESFAYRAANRDQRRAYMAAYREANPDVMRQWLAANPGRGHANAVAWHAAHPGANRAYIRNREARKIGAAGTCTEEQAAARWAMYGGRCWMCGGTATDDDHYKPLSTRRMPPGSKAASNWPANIRPACGPCNSRKHDKWPYKPAA